VGADDADRALPPEDEQGVHVSRDAPGSPEVRGRKRSKLGFRVQAQRRAKGDDPVFDNVRTPAPAPDPKPESTVEPAESTEAPVERTSADAGAADSARDAPGVLDRVARLFRRRGTDEST
jgi:hypothetical protein